MTYTIALLVCLISSPDRCHTVEVEIASCSAGGIAAVAQWAALNPAYRVEKWWPCKAGVAA